MLRYTLSVRTAFFPAAAVAITALVCSLAAARGAPAKFATTSAAQQAKDAAKKIKDRPIQWDPPNINGRLRSVSASPPCNVTDVLKQAGARAQELADNVPNFTADERIQYRALDLMGSVVDAASGTFEYLALFVPEGGGWTVQETRTPLAGTHTFPASAQDIGLPELAFIFLPRYQGDYEMACEGAAPWNGQAAWVIHFQQRPDKPAEMIRVAGTKYSLKLKGRAWLAADSGEVLHLESGILEPIPSRGMRNWWISIDYGPVQFPRQNARMWLPQTVDAYAEFDTVRTIIYHTFADFMMFSVHTRQEVQKPTEPH
ncbi:MAG: hypothetical protein WA020_03180 [Candidatus Acidiferrales bacterium]